MYIFIKFGFSEGNYVLFFLHMVSRTSGEVQYKNVHQ